jgi:hypothetical protein
MRHKLWCIVFATLDFLSEDFVTRTGLEMRKLSTKTHDRLSNGQRVTTSNVCEVHFFIAQLDFV